MLNSRDVQMFDHDRIGEEPIIEAEDEIEEERKPCTLTQSLK